MKLQFLGSGTAFVTMKENFNSNMVLLSETGKRLMIDCGSDARHSTAALNLTSGDIDTVFISHLHADHAGGLEWLALTRKFTQQPIKPKLAIHPSMVNLLWDHVLSGGLQTIDHENCTLTTFFELYPFKDETHFRWEGIDFELVKTLHIMNNDEWAPSYGLFFQNKQKKIFITTDTRFVPDQYLKYYQAADLIFHDCETIKIPSGVHSHLSELMTLPPEIRAKIWLYHYSDEGGVDPIKAGFLGFVKRGQVFE